MVEERRRLGEILIEARVLTEEQLSRALEIQRTDGRRLGSILLAYGFVPEPQLVQALSRQLSIPWVSLWHIDAPDDLLHLVPFDVARECWVVPVYIRKERHGVSHLYIAMDDPTRDDVLQRVSQVAGMSVRAMVAGPSDIAGAIKEFYGVDVGVGPAGLPARRPEPARMPSGPAAATACSEGSNPDLDVYDEPTADVEIPVVEQPAPAGALAVDVVEAPVGEGHVVTLEEDLVVESEPDAAAWQESAAAPGGAASAQAVMMDEKTDEVAVEAVLATVEDGAEDTVEPVSPEPPAVDAPPQADEPAGEDTVEPVAAEPPAVEAVPVAAEAAAEESVEPVHPEQPEIGATPEADEPDATVGPDRSAEPLEHAASLELPLRHSAQQTARREHVRRLRAAALTFLDGTTIDLGGRHARTGEGQIANVAELVSLLRAASRGETAHAPPSWLRWEACMAGLIELLVHKGIVTEDEVLEHLVR